MLFGYVVSVMRSCIESTRTDALLSWFDRELPVKELEPERDELEESFLKGIGVGILLAIPFWCLVIWIIT